MNIKNEKLIIVGCGDHSNVITEAAVSMGYNNIDYLVTNNPNYKTHKGKEIYHEIPEKYNASFFIAIGHNFWREKLYAEFIGKNPNAKYIYIVHPHSYISPSAKIFPGAAILPNSVINAGCKIKKGVIINVNCTVDHNSSIEEFSSLSPSSTVGGNSKIGKRSALLIGSSVISDINIGEDVVVGANSCVHSDLQNNSVCIGNPSRRIKFRKSYENYMS